MIGITWTTVAAGNSRFGFALFVLRLIASGIVAHNAGVDANWWLRGSLPILLGSVTGLGWSGVANGMGCGWCWRIGGLLRFSYRITGSGYTGRELNEKIFMSI